MFMSQNQFFQILFPHLQSLSGNQYINLKLSTVLPQTVLCIRGDSNRSKLLELICQIASIAISDNDCCLMKNIMQDMPLLYKSFCQVPPEEQYGLGVSIQNHSGTQYPMSSKLFNPKVNGMVFQIFQSSVSEWRCFQISLDFLSKSILMIHRDDIREKYLPCLLENMKKGNQTIKLRIIEVLVLILTKIPDLKSR